VHHCLAPAPTKPHAPCRDRTLVLVLHEPHVLDGPEALKLAAQATLCDLIAQAGDEECLERVALLRRAAGECVRHGGRGGKGCEVGAARCDEAQGGKQPSACAAASQCASHAPPLLAKRAVAQALRTHARWE
jgi:hypothetical protein